MTIFIKNKQTLQVDDFQFKCCIGKKGSTTNKKEGDKKTPKGIFEIENLYFRKDRIRKPITSLKCVEIKKNMTGLKIVLSVIGKKKKIKINQRINAKSDINITTIVHVFCFKYASSLLPYSGPIRYKSFTLFPCFSNAVKKIFPSMK